MRQFCKDVLEFLRQEYDDAYDFNIEHNSSLNHDNDTVKLVIKASSSYTINLNEYTMLYIYSRYSTGEYIEERSQYRWQKELIDMIEGS